MFGSNSRRPPAKSSGPAPTTARTVALATRPLPPSRTTTTTTATRAPPRPLANSSQSSPPTITTTRINSIIVTKKTVTTTVRPPPPSPLTRTLNALKRPPPSPKDEQPAKRASKGKSKGKAALSSSEDDSESSDDHARRKKSRSTAVKKEKAPRSRRMDSQRSSSNLAGRSSDLDPVTPSEGSDSELSSADEDYFATPKKAEGAPIVERSVAAIGEGSMEIKSAEELVLENRKAYVEYFVDPADNMRSTKEWAGSEIFTVELEFPAKGATEKFALLAPRTDDEYNPIEDVMRTILVILDYFLTPEQAQHHFGHLTGKDSFSAFLYNKSSSSSRANTPRAGTPKPSASSAPPSSAAVLSSLASATADSANPLDRPPSAPPAFNLLLATAANCAAGLPPAPSEPLARVLEKARSKRDGPAFLKAVERFNLTMQALKAQGVIERNVEGMKGVKEKVWQKVFYQCYDRAVGPDMDRLREYAAFSDNVYGELLPGFLNEIFEKTHLGPGKVFVDLGSGVGNCVVQAALATGAESYGFENMAHASHLARLQVVEAEKRFRLWGLNGGKMAAVEADFCDHPDVGAVMRRADVVLVNNEVFTSSLNERLSWLFLELPDSAKIVSLKPFLSTKSTHKITAHNVGSPFSILSQSAPLRYKPGSVSWKMEGGTYFYSRIDRGRVKRFVEKEEERARKKSGVRERREREKASSREGSEASTSTGTALSGSRAGSSGVGA